MRKSTIVLFAAFASLALLAGCSGSGGGLSYEGVTGPAVVTGVGGESGSLSQGASLEMGLSASLPSALLPVMPPLSASLAEAQLLPALAFTDTLAGPLGGSCYLDIDAAGSGSAHFSDFGTETGQVLDGTVAITGFFTATRTLTFTNLSFGFGAGTWSGAGTMIVQDYPVPLGAALEMTPPAFVVTIDGLVLRNDADGRTMMLDEAQFDLTASSSFNRVVLTGTISSNGARFYHPDLGWVWVKTDTYVDYMNGDPSYGRYRFITDAGQVFWIAFNVEVAGDYSVVMDTDGDGVYDRGSHDNELEYGQVVDGVFIPSI